jgi:elongator complex protein 2
MESAGATLDYISVGGNRHPAAADWDRKTGILAFGADNNVAIWNPLVSLASSWESLFVPF